MSDEEEALEFASRFLAMTTARQMSFALDVFSKERDPKGLATKLSDIIQATTTQLGKPPKDWDDIRRVDLTARQWQIIVFCVSCFISNLMILVPKEEREKYKAELQKLSNVQLVGGDENHHSGL